MAGTNATVLGRVSRLRNSARERGLSALIVFAAAPSLAIATSTSGNVRYLTGWESKYEMTLLFLPVVGEPVLFVARSRSVVVGRAALQQRIGEEPTWVSDIRQLSAAPLGETSVVRELLEERGVPPGPIGVVGLREMPADIYLGLTRTSSPWVFQEADDLLALQRTIKDDTEIELHRTAAKTADAMMYAGMNAAQADRIWASDIMVGMEHAGRALGAEEARCWVATGPSPDQTIEHLKHLRYPVVDGDRVQAGVYVTREGYWAHELRMGIKGKPTPEVRKNFDRVVAVQEAGLSQLRPGQPLTYVNRAMAELADQYSPYPPGKDPGRFRHGHVLGLDYAEPIVSGAFPQPEAGPVGRSDIVVRPGMVVELHPNFGVPGLGFFCIGDTVLVTDNGPEILTRFARDLYEI
jgi:Xaa-Pro aminopeptidase